MTVYETDVPGVGRKFELELDGDARAVVVLHHDGRRELFYRPTPDADSEKLLDLHAGQASRLGAILEGAYFETVDVDELDVPLGDAIMEWHTVGEESPLAGQSLRSANVRGETGASVVAIRRDGDTVANPEPDRVLRAGDVLVVLGTRTEQAAVRSLLAD
ncbi:MAG: cation:proton antiporter regulatory subunit [Haloferacaceae archaeon]